MGDCTYCGKPAGWFRSMHAECARRHELGTGRITSLARQAIRGGGDLAEFEAQARKIAAVSLIRPEALPSLLIRAWEETVREVLEDNVLSAEEEAALETAKRHFQWAQAELDRNGAYTTLVKGGTLRDVLEGKLPKRFLVEGHLPFNLQKDEQLVWAFPDVKYLEVRSRRSYVGGYQGVSIRVARGVYYRLGGFRGDPIEQAEVVPIGVGALGLTARHVYFASPNKSFRVRYDKIVSITPYSDGVGIQRDATTAKPQAFVTGDGWFTYNLLVNLANLQAGRLATDEDAAPELTAQPAAPVRGEEDRDARFLQAIVGESHYQDVLEAVAGGRTEEGVDLIVNADLILDDANPHDPHAVRVEIDGRTVGHLSRATARRYRLQQAGTAATSFTCQARIKGGWDRGGADRGSFGVWLNLSL